MSNLGPDDRFAIALAVGITMLITLVWRRRHGPVLIALAALVPAPLVALFSKQFDLAGWHGFMQASPIYQLMTRGGSHPEEPLFAGGALRYPWVLHWITAKLSALTGVNSLVLDLCMEAVALAVFCGAVAWLASMMTDDRVTIALSTLIAMFGISIFQMSLFLRPLATVWPSLWLETRALAVGKFMSVTAMPLAYAAMAVAAAAGVQLTRVADENRKQAVIIAICTFVTALVHPLSWLGILVWQGTIGIVLLARNAMGDRRRAAFLAAAVALPSLVSLPYLRSVGASESSDGWSGLTSPTSLLGAKVEDLAFYLVTLAALCYFNRVELRRRIHERHWPTVILLGVVVAMSLAYLVVRLPGQNEYKFMLHLVPAAAVLIAMSVRRLLVERRVIAWVLLVLLLIPGGRELGSRPWFRVTDEVRTDGPFLRALDPGADSLFQWVARETPTDAVFIAPDLRIPPLGRRSLYIAADAPWRGRDGWGLPRNSLLQWHVRRPDAVMYERQRNAAMILGRDWPMPASAVMAFIESDVPGRAIYVHADSAATMTKLDNTPGFSRRFESSAGAIYEYMPSRQAGGR
jgi:hypothetical protein